MIKAKGSRRWLGAALLGAVVALIAPVPHAKADAPCSARYSVSSDGTVTDQDTHLTWQQETDPGFFTWQEAKMYCENLTLAGGGWRLPSLLELQTLVDDSRYDPAIDPTAFPDAPSAWFWSASSFAGTPNDAWGVDFKDGHTSWGGVEAADRVRCVR